MYIFLSSSVIETAAGRMVLHLYYYDYVNIATGHLYQDSHWAYEFYNFSDRNAVMPLGVYNKTSTGCMGS